ncbi:HalOD1 output domain-containing protein [Natrialba taiwanensis]|uniref:HalOD1 output domain-containing protein n=1 Tax=Natrialba taiwanensis TaxID=160846 RepID=UPI0030840214
MDYETAGFGLHILFTCTSETQPTTELPPLYETIDPAAITGLFGSTPTHSRPTGRLTFDYCGYRIAVEARGSISITPCG